MNYDWCNCGTCNDCLKFQEWQRQSKNLEAQTERLNKKLPKLDVYYIQRHDGLFYFNYKWVEDFKCAEKFEYWQTMWIMKELEKEPREPIQEGEVYYRVIEQSFKFSKLVDHFGKEIK